MRDFEEHIELEAVGGTVDLLINAEEQGVNVSVTDQEGNLVTFSMTPKEARHVAACIVTACLPDNVSSINQRN